MKVFIAIFAIVAVVYTKPVTEKTELPHSREFYAGYIKAITDNFDQLFESDRQVRSTKDDEEKPKEDKENAEEKLNGKRDIIMEDEDENTEKKNSIPITIIKNSEYIPDTEEFEENNAVRRGTVQEGSGNAEFKDEIMNEGSGSEDDEATESESKKTNENDDDENISYTDDKIQPKANGYNKLTPQKSKTGVSARRSDGEGMAGDEEEDIREATADMQRSSRDQSPDDLQKMAQSTVTFLPTNVRNYKATPFVKKIFHYDPAPIPYGAFNSDADNDGEPMQRHYPPNAHSFGMFNQMLPHNPLTANRKISADPFSFAFPVTGSNYLYPSNHAETRNNIESAESESVDSKTPSSVSEQKAPSVPVEEPEIIPPPQISGAPLAMPEAEKQVKATAKDDCCCCCQPCCCHHCCCCQPICHHITHHHHHCNDVCHHHHHHDIYHHNTQIHPHHECCHHVHCHQHIHPHEHLHVCHHHEKQIHHHTPCCSCCHDDCCHDNCCHHGCGCHDCGCCNNCGCHGCGCHSDCGCHDCGCGYGHSGGSYGSY